MTFLVTRNKPLFAKQCPPKNWIQNLQTKRANDIPSNSETNRHLQKSAPQKIKYKIVRQRQSMTFLVRVKQTVICIRVPPKN
jgi:hypothetical protein